LEKSRTAIAVRSTIALPVLWIVWLIAMKGIHASTEPPRWLDAGSPVLWKLVLGSGLIAGAGGMALFYIALSMGEISRVKPIAFTIAPAVAVVLGWLALHEQMTLNKALGVVFVLIGVVLLSIGRAPAAT
jgi:uncharacterized membrane protein